MAAANWYNTVVGNLPSPRPIQEMTMGELEDFGKELIKRTKGNTGLGLGPGQGSSALGGFQVINPTRASHAAKLYGEGWRNKVYDADTQEAIGRSIWEEAKANKADLTKVWTGLSKYKEYKPTDFDAMEWDQIRPLILAKEASGYNGEKYASSSKPSTQAALPTTQSNGFDIEHIELPGNQMGLGYLAQKESELNALRGKLDAAEADREYYKSIMPKAGEELGLASMQIAMPNIVNTNVPVFDARKARQAGNRQVYLG